jgi:phosphatidate cytidylyltransferase
VLRIGTAAVLLALVLTTIWILPPWTTIALAAVAAALAGREVAQMAIRLGGTVPASYVGAASAILCVALAVGGGRAADAVLTGVILAMVVASGVMTLAQGAPTPATFGSGAVAFMAPIYVGLPLGAIAWVHGTAGPGATSWLLAVIAVSDTAQYYCGRAFGRRKLAPSVSPAKTIEGAIGGLVVGTIAGGALATVWLPSAGPGRTALLAGVLVLCGMAGDLFESLLKRSAGVKDSSHLVPGHGGVLDRIDSHLFAAPVFYLFVRYAA